MGLFRLSDTTSRHALWRALVGAVLGLFAVTALAAGEERPLLVVEQGAHSAPVRRIEASAARGLVVTASDDRTARVWGLASGQSSGWSKASRWHNQP